MLAMKNRSWLLVRVDKALLHTVDSLPREQKTELYEYLRNRLYNEPQLLPLSKEEKRILDERLEEAHRNPNGGIPLDQALKRIRAKS